MIDAHWENYDRRCKYCRSEIKELMYDSVITKYHWNSWVIGLFDFSMINYNLSFVPRFDIIK